MRLLTIKVYQEIKKCQEENRLKAYAVRVLEKLLSHMHNCYMTFLEI